MNFTKPEILELVERYSNWTNYACVLRKVCEDVLFLHRALETSHTQIVTLQKQLSSLQAGVDAFESTRQNDTSETSA